MQPAHPSHELAPWLRIAHRWDGLAELDDAGELSPTVRDFFRVTRFPLELVNKRTSWCAAFACTVCELAGIPHPHSARARDFLDSPHFVKLRAPVLGCLLIFERAVGGTVSETYGHVGFCDRELLYAQQDDVMCFGGNQDNRACSRRKKRAGLIACLWPKGWPLPPGAQLE
jgi:uncharacterized protein (TIGR02594 family)